MATFECNVLPAIDFSFYTNSSFVVRPSSKYSKWVLFILWGFDKSCSLIFSTFFSLLSSSLQRNRKQKKRISVSLTLSHYDGWSIKSNCILLCGKWETSETNEPNLVKRIICQVFVSCVLRCSATLLFPFDIYFTLRLPHSSCYSARCCCHTKFECNFSLVQISKPNNLIDKITFCLFLFVFVASLYHFTVSTAPATAAVVGVGRKIEWKFKKEREKRHTERRNTFVLSVSHFHGDGDGKTNEWLHINHSIVTKTHAVSEWLSLLYDGCYT